MGAYGDSQIGFWAKSGCDGIAGLVLGSCPKFFAVAKNPPSRSKNSDPSLLP